MAIAASESLTAWSMSARAWFSRSSAEPSSVAGASVSVPESVPPPLSSTLPSPVSVSAVPLAPPVSLTEASPAFAPESPPKTRSSASSRVGAKPILSPKETSTICSSGYCVPPPAEEDCRNTGCT